ncbi:cupredoxin domain-containing protein [Aidingimonas lacisalsi]|uniref:cupredoxin domain-containing protein n=1 Tax=Aidingimonas lacisalsi TaxID=2604086 RepID=UPI0011D1FE2C|nr:cupredoxin domain-containing protein [Aidingimonas lacisalsi]
MRASFLTLGFGLLASTAMATGEHEGDHSSQAEAELDRTVSVVAGDMWFDPEALNVEPGETIEFEIHNTGDVEHEFVIGDTGAQEKHREMMQETGSEGHHDDHASHSSHDMEEGEHGGNMPAVTIASGETECLVWTAPDNVDELEFACNIPGHYESGMYGVIDPQG